MSKLTDSLAAALDDCIIENFADIYVLDAALNRIAKKHDLADPAVIAAIATLADVGAAQTRLTSQPAKSLVTGLRAALSRPLRPPAKLLALALLDGAEREARAPKAPTTKKTEKKKLPAFARPSRLPPLVTTAGSPASAEDVEALLRTLMATALGHPPEAPFTPESLARLGRALALGWLSHGAEPKQAWGAWAAGHFPDDATARDLGLMARELGPRVGQFSKAQILVDVLGAMNSRAALEVLHELATKTKTRSVKDRARRAFDAAAKRAGVSQLDLADKLLGDGAPLASDAKDFVRRLEQRMVTGEAIPAVELIENVLQRDTVREHARGVVFGVQGRTKIATFTIGDNGELVDVSGKRYVLPSTASVIVVHPIDLSSKDLANWRARVAKGQLSQLDRAVIPLASTRALTAHAKAIKTVPQGAIYGLERFGWQRGRTVGGRLVEMRRELDGLTVSLDLEPGVHLGRGMGSTNQRITKITVRGEASPRGLSEVARELDTLRGGSS